MYRCILYSLYYTLYITLNNKLTYEACVLKECARFISNDQIILTELSYYEYSEILKNQFLSCSFDLAQVKVSARKNKLEKRRRT